MISSSNRLPNCLSYFNKQTDVIAFREECGHFHRGKIITSTRENILVMFSVGNENKITNTSLTDLMMLLPEQTLTPHSTSQVANTLISSIDVKALSLNIVLLRLKKTYINKLNHLVSTPYFQEDERRADIEFLNKNIFTIDRYLKNVLLKLRLRFEKDFGDFIRR